MAREKMLTITAADCTRQTFRAGGPGGQNQNKRDTGVRFIHPPSGARGESRELRTQPENQRAAWRRMGEDERFRGWVRMQHARITGETDRAVKDAMRPENLVIEYGPFED